MVSLKKKKKEIKVLMEETSANIMSGIKGGNNYK